MFCLAKLHTIISNVPHTVCLYIIYSKIIGNQKFPIKVSFWFPLGTLGLKMLKIVVCILHSSKKYINQQSFSKYDLSDLHTFL